MKKNHLLYICFIFFVLIQSVKSSDKGTIKYITKNDGLVNNTVSSIVQDSLGFIWIGTRGGLVRYDGNNFKNYVFDPDNSNSLSNNIITTIEIDKKGNLWIGTLEGGLNKFDPRTELFTHFVHKKDNKNSISQNWISTICEDANGYIWLGTSQAGLNRFHPDSLKIEIWQHDAKNKNSISSNMIRDIVEDQNGDIWISTNSGLNRYNPEHKNFVRYLHQEDYTNSLLTNEIRSLFIDKNHNMWIASQIGLSVFDIKTNKFTHWKYNKQDQTSDIFSNILTITQDPSHNIWIGTFKNGISKLDVSNNETQNWIKEESETNSLNSNFARALHIDKSGKIWIGTINGINILTPPNPSFKIFDYNKQIGKDRHGTKIYSILPYNNNELWLGTFNGLHKVFLNSNKIQSWDKENNDLKNNFVYSLMSRDEELWIGTLGGGINILNKNAKVIKYIDNNKESNLSLSDNQIYSMYEDRNGKIWIGTIFGGLNLYDPIISNIKHWKNDPNNPNSPSDNQIFVIAGDKKENIWFGTVSGGLNRYDPKTDKFSRWLYEPNNPNSISFNSINTLLIPENTNEYCVWIGTNGGGLNKFLPDENKFLRFYTSDGLADNKIIGLQEDRNGNIWVMTNKGLSKILKESNVVENYEIPSSNTIIELNEGVSAKNKNGEVFFAFGGKVFSFHPESLTEKIIPPELVLTDFKIYEKEVKIGPESPLQKSISYTKNIELEYADKLITFQFAALDFNFSMNATFQYMLEGFDENWIFIGNRNYISFTNLDPGEYILKIKTTSSTDENLLKLKLLISPPFWQTWWFFTLIFLSLAGTLVFLHLLRMRRALQIEHIKAKENEIIRQKAAEDFHDGLGHKLAKISLMSEALKTRIQNPQDEIISYLDKISESANSLNNDMRNFLWMLDPGKDSLFEIAVRLKDFGEELFDKTGIKLLVRSLPESLSQYKVNMEWKRHLLLIFKEAMNNALKHAQCSQVMLAFKTVNDALEISVTDDGIGFDQSQGYSGTGLKNMEKRSKILNSNFSLTSEPDKGTSLSLKLKLPLLVGEIRNKN